MEHPWVAPYCLQEPQDKWGAVGHLSWCLGQTGTLGVVQHPGDSTGCTEVPGDSPRDKQGPLRVCNWGALVLPVPPSAPGTTAALMEELTGWAIPSRAIPSPRGTHCSPTTPDRSSWGPPVGPFPPWHPFVGLTPAGTCPPHFIPPALRGQLGTRATSCWWPWATVPHWSFWLGLSRAGQCHCPCKCHRPCQHPHDASRGALDHITPVTVPKPCGSSAGLVAARQGWWWQPGGVGGRAGATVMVRPRSAAAAQTNSAGETCPRGGDGDGGGGGTSHVLTVPGVAEWGSCASR